MSTKPLNKHLSPYKKQQGASLFIALIILLVVTLLALSSAREVTLESRITGNYIEQQRLANSAESGLRDGEASVVASITPLEPTSSCAAVDANAQPPCLLNLINNAYTYTLQFATAGKYRPYHPKNGTQANSNTTINWYAMPAPSGGGDGEAENPEYGSMLGATGTFRYEVNSQAVNNSTSNVHNLRSTTAKLFDNGN
ncbi:PilX N-terminal domain-containing pilus assembly protein [Pseudomonas sp. LS44]|uniref:pilus assembly PilX family protein n=1 Tax=Pseudomonas sp. LS44 TaxID=1357074 RepID=UPI00215ABAF9|nr:PilX N-terminal domain-containing pilus assembly protein [Pseudomonas sp. LS44]UVE18495.1 PilX N-terminal domain-containing pilus assembly protein [Pseudomonas sp. LS44]